MMELVKATSDMVKKYTRKSCIAYAAVEDGNVYGISGYYIHDSGRVVFSNFDKSLRKKPKFLLKAAKAIVSDAGSGRLPLFAKADDCVEASERFLAHLGFVPYNKDVWIWQK